MISADLSLVLLLQVGCRDLEEEQRKTQRGWRENRGGWKHLFRYFVLMKTGWPLETGDWDGEQQREASFIVCLQKFILLPF